MSGCFTFSAFHIGLDGWSARRRFGELKRLSPLCLHARVYARKARPSAVSMGPPSAAARLVHERVSHKSSCAGHR